MGEIGDNKLITQHCTNVKFETLDFYCINTPYFPPLDAESHTLVFACFTLLPWLYCIFLITYWVSVLQPSTHPLALEEIPNPERANVGANPSWSASVTLSTVCLPCLPPPLSRLPCLTATPMPGISKTGPWLVELCLSRLCGRFLRFCLVDVSAVSGFQTTIPSTGQVGCSWVSHWSMHATWYCWRVKMCSYISIGCVSV